MVESIRHTEQTPRILKRIAETKTREEKIFLGLNTLYAQGQELLEKWGEVRRVDYYGTEETFKIIVCPLETKGGTFTVIMGADDDSDKPPMGIDVLGPQKPGEMFLNRLILYRGKETPRSRKWEEYGGIEEPDKFVADFISSWEPPTYEHLLNDEDSPILLPLDQVDIEDYRELLAAVEKSLQTPRSEMPPTT